MSRRLAFPFACVLVVGCGSTESPAGAPDAATDAVTKDTGVETSLDARLPPVSCNNPLPSDFSCEPVRDAPGSGACTDAAIDGMLSCFRADGSETACAKAQADFPSCAQCVMKDWLLNSQPSSAACVSKVDPGGPCARIVQCNADCLAFVCSGKNCDATPGSGTVGTRSELQDCYVSAQFAGSSAKAKGACYDLASKDYGPCATDAKYTVCFPRTVDDLRLFFRGACRDGGNFGDVGASK